MDFGSCFDTLLLDVPVYLSAATALGLAVLFVWIRRHEPFFGSGHFQLTVLAMALWVLATSLEMAVQPLSCKMAMASATWPMIAITPIAYSLFIYQFCFSTTIRLRGPVTVGAALLIAAISAAALGNPWHGQFYGDGTMLVADGPRPHARYDHGPLFHAAAGVLYAVLLLGLGITAVAAFMAPRPLRPMMMILLFGTATPIVANIGYVAFDVEILGFDPTPFAFSFVLLALTWVIYATRGFDLGTMARDLLYYTNKEPVLVVNANGMVSNANPAARALLPDAVPGQPIDPAGPLAALGPGADRPPGSDGRQEIAIGARTFTMRVLPINRPLSRAGGRLAEIVILTDVTDAKAKQARLAEALALTNQQLAEITRLREIAERLALADPLTGIGNRRSLMVRIEELRKRPCALALIDLDHFKRINDRLGHSVGDRVLRDFTALLRGLLPDGAELFRVGGEEFVLLMPDATISDLLAVLNRFNAALIDMPPLRDNDHHRVSFSAGVAVRPGDGDTFDALYGRADARLYQAKRAGRSRVMHLDCLSFPAEVASTPPTDERAPRLDHQ